MECKATKTKTIFNFAIIDKNADVVEDGSVTADNEQAAVIELARTYPDAEPRHILVQRWRDVEVANPDAIATVRVINATEDDE